MGSNLMTMPIQAAEETGIEINAINFPDSVFREVLKGNAYDTNADGKLSGAEIAKITALSLNKIGITSLQGIEYLTSLEELSCRTNDIRSLDISKNTALKRLDCNGCLLESLDVSKNTALTYIDCNGNNLTGLDVSKNVPLEFLYCSGNKIKNLDVSNNTMLQQLYCDSNILMSSLKLGANSLLEQLYCSDNALTSLDTSGCTALQAIICNVNELSGLNVSKNASLKTLDCSSNLLNSLDVSKNTALTYLDCQGNSLTSLDLSNNVLLELLYCSSNQLSNLDVSSNLDLIEIYDSDNLSTYILLGAKECLVEFDANNGTTDVIDKTVVKCKSYGELPTPTRAGYRFTGWYTAKTDGVEITAETIVKITGNQTLYAGWSANDYTVTFNANNGSVSTKSKSVTHASIYGTLPTPTRTGYTFSGWYTAKSGGSKVTASSTVNITANTTLYARWTAKKYTVKFNANSGSVSTKNKTVTYASTYGTLPSPTRSKYTFSGWYTAKNGGTKVTKSSKVSITKEQTLYARWMKVTVGKGTVSKLKNSSSKKVAVTVKKLSGVKGYEVQYSTNKSFKSARKTTSTGTSITLKSLSKGKTYYVRVRGYKLDSKGNKVYGYYSTAKTVMITK